MLEVPKVVEALAGVPSVLVMTSQEATAMVDPTEESNITLR